VKESGGAAHTPFRDKVRQKETFTRCPRPGSGRGR
jgi:hypothetical protein